MLSRSHRKQTPWLAIRQELPAQRQALLTLLSFVIPLGLWCLVSYTPYIWHPAVKLDVSADMAGSTTVYTAGDHISRDYFPTFEQAVQLENAKLIADRRAGIEPTAPQSVIRRTNIKILRHLAPAAVTNGWLKPEDAESDEAIREVWRGVTEGTLSGGRVRLTDENMRIVRDNWQVLRATDDAVPTQPLLKLVPQGRTSNPDYLPAPHEVLWTGWADWTTPPSNGPWMYQRLIQSLQIVFGGFLLSCVFGVPLGILCGTFNLVSRLFEPFIDFFRYMPAPTFSTLLVAIFLAHDAPKIALVFVGTFFQMVLVIAKTTRLLDPSLLEAAQTLGASRRRLLMRVIVPGILPNLYNDLRILLGWSWTWLVIAELIGVKSGLTEYIETQGRWRNFEHVFPVIILIGLFGFFTDQILQVIARRLFPWEYTHARLGFFATTWRMLSGKRAAESAEGAADVPRD